MKSWLVFELFNGEAVFAANCKMTTAVVCSIVKSVCYFDRFLLSKLPVFAPVDAISSDVGFQKCHVFS